MRRAIISLILLSAVGCFNLQLTLPQGQPIHVVVLGESSNDRWLQPGSEVYQQLQTWVAQNQRGWSQLNATPPATGVLVEAGNVRLQFVDESALVTNASGVFTKRVKEADYAFLLAGRGS